LGSFPTWSLTTPDNDKNETYKQKELERIRNKDVEFFYGSSINRFWNWYKTFVDPKIERENIKTIIESLELNSIGITDVIFSCERANKSALDKHLTNRIYNHQFFNYPSKGETVKILCTSKGVMNEMLFNPAFFKIHNELKANTDYVNVFQTKLLEKIGGDLSPIRNPFFRSFETALGGLIQCIALPSPGSPYRRLIDFGLVNSNAEDYLQSYLKEAFNWFVT
jgi:hypothetical protein